MNTALIGPDNLEVDAVVPQCLDNQYVSDRVFSEMIEHGVDYRDKRIAELRENDFRTSVTRCPRPAKPLFQRIRHSLHSLDTDARIRV